jgi:hypothetical protein
MKNRNKKANTYDFSTASNCAEGAMAATNSVRRLSATPPLTQQPLSKRDKKRSQIENRVKDIAAGLTAHRDVNLRTQLNALSRDMLYINRAELYAAKRLDDQAEDLVTEIPNINAMGSLEPETARLPLGSNAARFVEQVNCAMDERDANIANLHVSFFFFCLPEKFPELIISRDALP